MARDMFKRFWDARLQDNEERHAGLNTQVANTERKIDSLTDRLIETDSPTLISAYESQIKKLELKKIALNEKARAGIEPLKPFDETFKSAM